MKVSFKIENVNLAWILPKLMKMADPKELVIFLSSSLIFWFFLIINSSVLFSEKSSLSFILVN